MNYDWLKEDVDRYLADKRQAEQYRVYNLPVKLPVCAKCGERGDFCWAFKCREYATEEEINIYFTEYEERRQEEFGSPSWDSTRSSTHGTPIRARDEEL